jgi:hypothetical protein
MNTFLNKYNPNVLKGYVNYLNKILIMKAGNKGISQKTNIKSYNQNSGIIKSSISTINN